MYECLEQLIKTENLNILHQVSGLKQSTFIQWNSTMQ